MSYPPKTTVGSVPHEPPCCEDDFAHAAAMGCPAAEPGCISKRWRRRYLEAEDRGEAGTRPKNINIDAYTYIYINKDRYMYIIDIHIFIRLKIYIYIYMHLTYLQSGSKKRQTETKAQSRGPKPGRSREPQQEAEAGAEARERNRGPTPPGTAGRRPGPGDQGPREFGSLRSHFQSIILLNKEAQLCVYRTETKVQQNKTTVSPSARKHRNNTGSSPRGRAAGPSSRQQQPMPEYCRRRETHWMSPLVRYSFHSQQHQRVFQSFLKGWPHGGTELMLQAHGAT